MQLLKQSTTASIVIGPVLDSAGAEYAGAVIGDISLSKNGGTLTALASAATITYIANGQYTLALTTGNTDTLGRADLFCNKSTYQMPPVRLTVLAATPFDTLITNGTLASTTSGRTLVVDASGLADANAVKVGPTGSGTAQTARDLGASVLLSSGTGTGQLDFTSGVVKANATQWVGGTIPAVNVTGVPLVDAKYLLGTVFSTPTVAGIPNVNAKTWNDLATVALPLIPTTAGRALDVSVGGEAGIDWANVGSPTTTLALTNTTVSSAQVAASVTANVSAVLADGVAHGGTPGSSTATLALSRLVAASQTTNEPAVKLTGNGTGAGLRATGGAGGSGVYAAAGAGGFAGLECVCTAGFGGIWAYGNGPSVPGLSVYGGVGASGMDVQGDPALNLTTIANTAPALWITSGGAFPAVKLGNGHSGTEGLVVLGNGAAAAVQIGNGNDGAEGVKVLAGVDNTDADGVTATGAGTGVGFRSTPDAVGFGGGVTFPANFSALVIDAGGHVLTDRVAFSGTLGSQALGDVFDIVLPTGPASNGVLVGSRLRVYSGTGQYQERTITSWDGTNKIAGIDHAWLGVSVAPGDLFHVLYDNAPRLDGSGNVAADAHVSTIGSTALGQFFTLNSGQTYASAVAGSVVKEVATGGPRPTHHSARG